MEVLKKPIWRVPLVLAGTGILCRVLSFLVVFVWTRLQIARGPDPVTGSYQIGTGYMSEILAVVSFLLFWAAGWKFLRGLTRRQIFASATIMVLWGAALLAGEQLSQAAGNMDLFFGVYHLQATTDAMRWATQLLVRIFDEVSVPVVIPGLLAPYLYLLLGRRADAADA